MYRENSLNIFINDSGDVEISGSHCDPIYKALLKMVQNGTAPEMLQNFFEMLELNLGRKLGD